MTHARADGSNANHPFKYSLTFSNPRVKCELLPVGFFVPSARTHRLPVLVLERRTDQLKPRINVLKLEVTNTNADAFKLTERLSELLEPVQIRILGQS